MKDKHSPFYISIFYGLLVLEVFCIMFISMQEHNNDSLQIESLFSMNDNWTFYADNGNIQSLTLPAIMNAGDDNSITISHKIPDNFDHVTNIGLLTTYQSIIAYIDGRMVYSRVTPTDKDQFFNVCPGSVWDLIPLISESKGKTLTLVISSEYPYYAGRVNEVHAGTKASILLHVIDTFGMGFIMSVIIFLMGIFLIFLYVLIRRLLHVDKSLFYLGWFSILSGIWLMMESNLSQLFLTNAYVTSTIGYLSLMTFPIPILLYTNLFEGYHFKKLNTWLIYSLLVSTVIIIFLQFFNILDFNETLPELRVLLFFILGIALITLWLELIKYKNKEVQIFTIAASILFVFSILELSMYQQQTEHITGNYFRTGFYLFLILLAVDGIKKIVNYVKLSERVSHYRKLAYRDPLTNCRNRVAYEMDLENIDTTKTVTIFMADMNNMKEINDTYGHQIGDEVVILCSHCLLKNFGHAVYRIGGDEFLCIEYNLTQEKIDALLEAFYLECEETNASNPYKFILSIGYATFDSSIDFTIHNTVKRADDMMYAVKEQMKQATEARKSAVKKTPATGIIKKIQEKNRNDNDSFKDS
ncbi:MAG: diguanylate cyclase [Firmicutes bacterium]|nr:diguanylate cyclase [Bacillota bacterium]